MPPTGGLNWASNPSPQQSAPGDGAPGDDGRRWYNMFDPMGLTPAGYHQPSPYLPNYQQHNEQLQTLLNGQNPFASGGWDTLIGQLQQRANGAPGTSMAEQQYRQAQGDSSAQLSGMAHGGNSPAAFRQAAIEQGRIGQGLSQGLATQGLAERNSAQQQLQGAMGTRDQLNQNAYLNILAQQLGLSKDQMAALIANGQQQTNGLASQNQGMAGMMGGIAAMASDRDLKTAIQPAGAQLDEMLDALEPYTYAYRDTKHGDGVRAGIMAQDLERSELGRDIVLDTVDGKMLDGQRALSAALAALARLNQRIRVLEQCQR